VPLAATVRLEISDEGETVSAGWEFDRQMVSHHNAGQTAGGPWEPRPTMKFQILGRSARHRAPVNFPFVAIADDGVHTLPKGTPLVQVIPFPRDEGMEGVVRVESDAEAEERRRVYINTLAGEGWYRRESRARR
jgi:hypothetical protein